MNLIKNGDIDKEAALKYLDNQVKEADFNKMSKESFNVCVSEMEPHILEIQKRANFTIEQCNVKYETITSCMEIAVFAVSNLLEQLSIIIISNITRIVLNALGMTGRSAMKARSSLTIVTKTLKLWKNSMRIYISKNKIMKYLEKQFNGL